MQYLVSNFSMGEYKMLMMVLRALAEKFSGDFTRASLYDFEMRLEQDNDQYNRSRSCTCQTPSCRAGEIPFQFAEKQLKITSDVRAPTGVVIMKRVFVNESKTAQSGSGPSGEQER
jgi:hypothetical protein